MKKVLVVAAIGLCLAGCSSNQEEKQEPTKTSIRRVTPASSVSHGSRGEEWQLHRKQLEKAGAEYDENGNMKEGSLARILENGGK